MALGSLLFFVAGLLDGAYPGGSGWIDRGRFSYVSHVFGLVSLIFAVAIARGSERGLLARILLAAIFFGGAVGLAYAHGPRLDAATAAYLVTAMVELLILVNAIRLWRVGQLADARDLDAIFSLDAPLPVPDLRTALAQPPLGPPPVLPARTARIIGVLSIALVLVLIGDGVIAGFVPGGVEWQLYGPASGWLTYLFAGVVAAVAIQALSGSLLSLRLLLVVSLLLFVERPFSPFVLGQFGVNTVAMHALGAFVALGLALASVAGLRSAEARRRTFPVDAEDERQAV